ncbi:sensor histidine kinase [Microbacterium sp. NPDC058342]|uniref:sensor histidine kinase n=1 Tax=Microbacterium sp. NPDC058342 TaxID=3346454 RepID=UPI003666267A
MARRVALSRSIRARVTTGAFIVVAIALGVGAVATVQILSGALTEGVRVAVEQDLETIGEQVEAGTGAIEGIDGDLLVRLGDAVSDDDAAELPAVAEDATARVVVDGDAYLAASEETDAGTLTVARPLEHVEDAVATATALLAVAVPLLLVLIAVVVWVVAGRALAPVERLRRQVDAIGPDRLGSRVDAGEDELGSLAETMNRMLERIEHAQSVQRRFVSDASHELRSPLATIRQHAEVAAAHPHSTSVEALSQVVRHEGIRMQDLVEGLLLLARIDEHQQHPAEPVDLDDLALAEASRLRGMGAQVDTRGVGAGRVRGSRALLSRAVRNLADNAARHAARIVTIRVSSEQDRVVLVVEDDGNGIPPEHRRRIFDRFARLDEGRARDEGGSGLGLAIVHEVAALHRGTVTVDAGAHGGARFTLTLPGSPGA